MPHAKKVKINIRLLLLGKQIRKRKLGWINKRFMPS
jgi:hypothetical protein